MELDKSVCSVVCYLGGMHTKTFPIGPKILPFSGTIGNYLTDVISPTGFGTLDIGLIIAENWPSYAGPFNQGS